LNIDDIVNVIIRNVIENIKNNFLYSNLLLFYFYF
jgi:hypothetical protein